jgi:uncharacterized protein YndB with AHSA1/START domain
MPKKSSEIVIEQPVSVVWDAVTNSDNFSKIIQGAWYWGPFDRNTARAGTNFKKGNWPEEKVRQWDYYIVNWDPPHRFSMGGSPQTWDFNFDLTDLGAKTQVRYTRRFNILGWLLFSRRDVEYTVNALDELCGKLAREKAGSSEN